MELKQIVSLDIAKKWQNGSEKELKELAFYIYPELAKKELPKSWDDLEKISGYYITTGSELGINEVVSPLLNEDQNIFFAEKQAKSALAMAKLSQLMAVYNDGWLADWKDYSQKKYCILFSQYDLVIWDNLFTKFFLAFKTKELAEEFLSNFREDIETYFNF
jgi:hypothetical protein